MCTRRDMMERTERRITIRKNEENEIEATTTREKAVGDDENKVSRYIYIPLFS